MLEASLGEPQHHESLTVFPILAEVSRELPYILLADALSSGVLTIGEKNGGQVPFLLARNTGPDPVLILDGEQLIGARQNRMTNRSILLAPKSTTEIPVSRAELEALEVGVDDFPVLSAQFAQPGTIPAVLHLKHPYL